MTRYSRLATKKKLELNTVNREDIEKTIGSISLGSDAVEDVENYTMKRMSK